MARKINPRYEALKVITNEKDNFYFMGSLHNNTHYYQAYHKHNDIGTKNWDEFVAWVKRAEKRWKEGETQSLYVDCRVNHWTNGKLFEKKVWYSFKINEAGNFEYAGGGYCTFEEYNTPVGEHQLKGIIDHRTKDINDIIKFIG